MEAAETDVFRKFSQRDIALEISVDELARLLDGCRLSIVFGRAAALARAIAGTLGLTAAGEKLDSIALRTAAWTRWTAKDSGRAHSVKEPAIMGGVPRQHCLPLCIRTHQEQR